ncbi:MAG TPA: hypothetical protein VLA43_02390 [Longimicrobiales bacterium]|nr:hypothetical protein [Longimicrobiales bacterium]
MTEEQRSDPHPEPTDTDADAPVTDPAHWAALLAMVAAPVLLGAVVYLLLKALSG